MQSWVMNKQNMKKTSSCQDIHSGNTTELDKERRRLKETDNINIVFVGEKSERNEGNEDDVCLTSKN
jgi:hypothetical protein